MKTSKLVMIALMGLTGWVRAEMVSLVQITDMRGQVGYQVMSHEEFAALTKELKEETTIFPATVAECKKEWEANKDNKLPFQGAKIKPRSAKKMGADFADREKAGKKLSQMEDRASARQSEESKKEEQKAKQSKPKDEENSKEAARAKAIDDAFGMVSTKMGEKLKRPVPSFGFQTFDAKKDDAKKEEPKKDEKKKEEPKKDEKKKDDKKAGK